MTGLLLRLRDVVSTTSGARGWFVAMLTDPDLGHLFEAPIDECLLSTIEAKPEPNLKLMVMNVAMSSATALAHDANGRAQGHTRVLQWYLNVGGRALVRVGKRSRRTSTLKRDDHPEVGPQTRTLSSDLNPL